MKSWELFKIKKETKEMTVTTKCDVLDPEWGEKSSYKRHYWNK